MTVRRQPRPKPGCTPVFLTDDDTPVSQTADTAGIPVQRVEDHYRVAIDLDDRFAFVVKDIVASDPDTATRYANQHLREAVSPRHLITGWHVDRLDDDTPPHAKGA